jgi:hypothetical protein
MLATLSNRRGEVLVNSLGERGREGAGEHTGVRIPAPIKRRLEEAARQNRKSLSAEIVARLAQSLELAAPAADPAEVPSSQTARDALAMAHTHREKIDNLEVALMAICSEVSFLNSLPPEARAAFTTALKIIGRDG